MPETIHCRVKGCRAVFRVKNFSDQMTKIRHHRKLKHPALFRKSIKKSIETRKSKGRFSKVD